MGSDPGNEALRNQNPRPKMTCTSDPPKDEKHSSTFIWLHDSVSSGNSLYTRFAAIMKRIKFFREKFPPGARHIFPTGPVHNNRGCQWYENKYCLIHLPQADLKQWEAVAVAVKSVDDIVNREAENVGRANVVMVPFLESIESIADNDAGEADPGHPLFQADNNTTISDPFNNDRHTSFGLQSNPHDIFDRSRQETTSVGDNTTITKHSTPMTELSSSAQQASSQVQCKPGNSFSESQQQSNQATILNNNTTTTCNDATTINPVNSGNQTFICSQSNPSDAVDSSKYGQHQRADGHDFLLGAGTSSGIHGCEDRMYRGKEEQTKRKLLMEVFQDMAADQPELAEQADLLFKKARRERVAYFLRQFFRSPEDRDSSAEHTDVDTPVFLVKGIHHEESKHARDWLRELGFEVKLQTVNFDTVSEPSLDLLVNTMKTHGIGP
ncbi:hypothetical protein FSARC_7899 [Fusarium sarcochroum]|uniref:Uncharacterized protein n=1 Tax=Fusarium sarcochroum TaxID=1208366 RepID=A0A8H4TUG5_9HYPO|nr:hypothetical protein FSARC_7899 [Fusarium sarcochroum]